MQVIFDVGQIARQESTVGTNRVATQRNRARLGYVSFDEIESLLTGLLEGDR